MAGIKRVEQLVVEGPEADAELLAGWLRSRLRRPVRLTRKRATSLVAVTVDGEPVGKPVGPRVRGASCSPPSSTGSTRDPVYEAAVLAVSPRDASRCSWRRPFDETAVFASIRGSPAKSLNRPPASSTITWSAARSQSETPTASIAPSTAPSATSMWLQKSP